MRRVPRIGLVLTILIVTAGVAVWCFRYPRDGSEIGTRTGQVVRVDSVELPGGASREYRHVLESDAGTRVRMRVRIPRHPTPPLQLVVLIDGQGVGADAIELLPEDAGTVAASLDYPESFPTAIEPLEALLSARALRDAALRVPASVLLAVDHLSRRPDVDTSRIAVIGSSLGVPAAVIATALDPRVDGVALVYGGGDLRRMLEANLALDADWLRGLASRFGAWLLGPLEPTRYADRIAPRPLVMVNGQGDTRIPRASVEALFGAAREPKKLVWLETGHLHPADTALVRELVDSAVANLPVLTRTP